MESIFLKFFKKSTVDKQTKKYYKKLKVLSIMSDDINKKKEELDNLEYELLHEKKDEMFISLSDFLDLLVIKHLKIQDILTRCKHVSELDPTKNSAIEVYMIVENGHIVLCPDVKECETHMGYKGDKVKIVSVRK